MGLEGFKCRGQAQAKSVASGKWQVARKNGILAACYMLLLFGCATQASMVDLELEHERVKLRQAQIQERLGIIEGYSEGQSVTTQRDQTDLIIKLDQLATDLQTLQGKLEETAYLSADLALRMDDKAFRSKELTDRLNILDRQVVLLKDSIAQLSEYIIPESQGDESDTAISKSQPSQDRGIVLPGRPTQEDRTVRLSPSEAYGLAYNDFIKGNYDLALMGFENFLSQYKTTSLAPNAQYWIGESHYGKKEYRKAIEAWQKVVSDYPKNNKVAGALLKTGYAYIQLADRGRAKGYLRKVIEDYPFSNEAKLAKNRLAELK